MGSCWRGRGLTLKKSILDNVGKFRLNEQFLILLQCEIVGCIITPIAYIHIF